MSLAGFFTICFMAWLTGKYRRVNRKTVGGSTVLAWVIAGLVFWFPGSKWVLAWINQVLVATLAASQISFVKKSNNVVAQD